MYISEVYIKNFRCFREFRLELNPVLTVLVGENNIGKTNFLRALALIFSPNATSLSRHLELDDIWMHWHRGSCVGGEGAEEQTHTTPEETDVPKGLPVVTIQVTIAGLETVEEKALVAKWLVNSKTELKARVTYQYRPVTQPEGKIPSVLPIDNYEWVIYGGEVEREQIDFRDLARIRLELLPALRDAEREMSRGSRRLVGNLVSRFKPDGYDTSEQPDRIRVDEALAALNESLEKAKPIAQSEKQLNAQLGEVAGQSNKQSAVIKPFRQEFDDLARNLRVLVGPQQGLERDIELNGLGYNNLLYVAALLTDFYQRRKLRGPKGITLPVVGIEEPEAHLHPHLQKLLNRYFASRGKGQAIVTTHSTHVSSSVDPSHIVVLHRSTVGDIRATSVGQLFEGSKSLQRQLEALARYLDATRSTLFFGKSVMLVEGLAEAVLLPVISKHVLKFDIDDKGISIVAVGGVGFRPFARLFGRERIQRRCAVLTDSDPGHDCFPLVKAEGYSPSRRVINLEKDLPMESDGYVRVFSNLKTLEHDIIVAGNRQLVTLALERAIDLSDRITRPAVQTAMDKQSIAAFSRCVLQVVSDAKGAFAQALAAAIAAEPDSFTVPGYITDAFGFLLGRDWISSHDKG